MIIAVEGPDGCGKSTFIEILCKRLSSLNGITNIKFQVYHFRPNFFPNLGKIGSKTRIMKEDTNFSDPHRGRPVGKISSLIRMFYYWIDYLIGVPILLYKSNKSNTAIIFDRYIYDFLIDPHRSRIYLPNKVRKVFSSLVIQPHIVFVLVADPETIYMRKQELTITEISRQLEEFIELSMTNERFILIDASKSQEEMVEKAIKVFSAKVCK